MVKLYRKLYGYAVRIKQVKNEIILDKILDNKKITAVCALMIISLLAVIYSVWISAVSTDEEVQLDTAPHIQVAQAENKVPHFERVYSVDKDFKKLKDPFIYAEKNTNTSQDDIVNAADKNEISDLKRELRAVSSAEERKNSMTGKTVSEKEEGVENRIENQLWTLKAVLNIDGNRIALADVDGRVMRLGEGSIVGQTVVSSIGADSVELQFADGTVETVKLR